MRRPANRKNGVLRGRGKWLLQYLFGALLNLMQEFSRPWNAAACTLHTFY